MHRSRYWSCTKFAEWLRGTPKPKAGTGDEWKQWNQAAQAAHKFRFWLAETALDNVQNFLYWPYDKLYALKYYITNRWVDQSHCLVAHPKHIKPGQWMDLDYRILVCLFDELVDFVEIEQAYGFHRWDEEKVNKLKFWQGGIWRTRTWRSPESGIAYLKWAMTLTDEEFLSKDQKHLAKPTGQAVNAKEILELYTWWTEVYPNRPDPYDLSGWSDYCDDKTDRGIGFMETDPNEDPVVTRSILNKSNEIEKKYSDEETEMLIRLIKVRSSLWT